MGRKLTNEEFQERLRQFREQGHDVYCDDEYIDSKTRLWFYCSKGHRWYSQPNWVFNGQFCPYCLNRRVLIGYNDLWTTHREIAKLLQDPEIGYKHTYGSKYETNFVCPICGNIIFKSIKNVYSRGLACPRCADTISYPNKFMRAMLKQLDVQNIKHEYSPSWLGYYSFDNYFEINGLKILLEADGGVGHGHKAFGSNDIDTIGIKRDRIKDDLALEHGMRVVRIDCNYQDFNKYKYIKQQIMNSELTSIVDLSCVDWDECHAEALSSLVYKSAVLYNDGYGVGEISCKLGYNSGTINSWLKQATQIGLCAYSKEESRRRGRRILYRTVNQYTKDGIFVQTYKCMNDASLATDVDQTPISRCCRKEKHFRSAGGYLWFFSDDPDQPDKSKIILTIQN